MKTPRTSSRLLPLLVANIVVCSFTVAAAVSENSFVPTRVSYQDLQNLLEEDNHGDNIISMKKLSLHGNLQSILRDVGIFSITDIPLFGNEKPQTLGSLPGCVDALLQNVDQFPGHAASHMFPDGTVRKTIATTGDKQALFGDNHVVDNLPMDCTVLREMSGAFRDTVAEVTRTVGRVLMRLQTDNDKVSSSSSAPNKALVRNQAGDKSYNLAEIVAQGEHLEHFHVYHKPNAAMEQTASNDDNNTTIDWHTDQGLMLVFSPGTMTDGATSQSDFYIQLSDGQAVPVRFESKDELVVLMGEGVNQYVNNQLATSNEQPSIPFRAVPHSLSLRSLKGDRVWYGRMVLPPADAIHPVQKRTFGELRRELIASNSKDPPVAFGCGSANDGTSEQQQQHRQLQDLTEEDCNLETQHFCWHRCMNYTEEVSPTACAEVVTSDDPHEVACHDPNTNELWSGDHNMKFQLGCVASDVVAAFQNNATDDEEDVDLGGALEEEEADALKDDEQLVNSESAALRIGGLGTFGGVAIMILYLFL